VRTAEEIIRGHGHPNIRALHKTTFEITREEHLTPRGDCIIVVGADRGALHLSDDLKKLIQRGAKVRVIIEVDGVRDEIVGKGNPKLTLTDPISLVGRKSEYVCPRTFMVKANKSARDLNRELIMKLREEFWKEVTVRIIAEIDS